MKIAENSWLATWTIVGGIGLALGGCTKSAEEKKAEVRSEASQDIAEEKQEASEDIRDIREEAAEDIADIDEALAQQTQEQFAETMDARLDKLEDRIAKVDDRMDDLGNAATPEMKSRLTDAVAKKDAARTKLGAFEEASAENWRTLRNDVNTSINSLSQSVDQAERTLTAH